jgi:cytochrome b
MAPAVQVWDPLVRIGHWLLALSIAAAWFTREGWGLTHEVIGYVSLGVIGARLIWGFFGTPHARFADFVRGPRATLRYVRLLLAGREPRYLGHNPLGAWMIAALLATALATALSGWLYTTDRYWGVEWVERLHGTLTDVLLVLVALHVTGVLFASRRHRENLIAAMFHGRKRPADAAPP